MGSTGSPFPAAATAGAIHTALSSSREPGEQGSGGATLPTHAGHFAATVPFHFSLPAPPCRCQPPSAPAHRAALPAAAWGCGTPQHAPVAGFVLKGKEGSIHRTQLATNTALLPPPVRLPSAITAHLPLLSHRQAETRFGLKHSQSHVNRKT